MNKNVIMASVVLAFGVILSGCGQNDSGTSVEEETPPYSKLYPTEVTMDDGHTVQCVMMEGYKSGGLSCDWDNQR